MDRGFYRGAHREGNARGRRVEELGLFYLGESFMCDWLPEAIAYAKDVGFPYVFLTAMARSATPASGVHAKAGLDSLKFSYNYADANRNPGRTSPRVKRKFFDIIIENIRMRTRCAKERLPVRAVCLVHRVRRRPG